MNLAGQELLVASFGTSYVEARRRSIEAVENALASAYPDWSVRRGFTSQRVLKHIRECEGVWIDNVPQALKHAAENGVKTLVVQPTHMMKGFEYAKLTETVRECAGAFERVVIGEPLLSSAADIARVADAVLSASSAYSGHDTAVCLMGHGTQSDSNGVYEQAREAFLARGADNYYVATVEAAPSVRDALSMVRAGHYRKVILLPFMLVAGEHVREDMAGDGPESWKSIFESAGYEVLCVPHGLGELEAVQQLFVEHAGAAIERLKAPGTGLLTLL